MSSVDLYVCLVAAVAVERLAELVVSQRHLAWARARGGVEFGRGHYPAMVLLHVGLLAGCVAEVIWLDRPFMPALGWPMLALCLLGLVEMAIGLRGRVSTKRGPPTRS